MQRFLSEAVRDEDAVLQDVRAWVVQHLGDPDAVLVIDETGDVKKGRATVGVQRQYTGTAGRIENSQVAVYLTYTSAKGHALIGRSLYFPVAWTDDPERLREAGVPEDVVFATKPALAQDLVLDALDGQVPAGWVAGDEVYGGDSKLRKALHSGASATSWRSLRTTRSEPGLVLAGRSIWPCGCVRTAGTGSPPVAVSRANAGKTGPSSTPPTLPPARVGTTGC